MLGGIKAALGAGGRRGPVLPLSGAHVAREEHFRTTSGSSPPRRSAAASPVVCDEETPSELWKRSMPPSPKRFCELTGSYVDIEAPATASTACPPTTAGSPSPRATFGDEGFRGPLAAQPEARLGLTQLVISLDLDILGPRGLLAQLGLPSQHELEAGALRVQCNGMEVHHRTQPESARTSISRPSSTGAASNAIDVVTDAMAQEENSQAHRAAPEQFYIGDVRPPPLALGKRDPTAVGGKLLPTDFAQLFAVGASQQVPAAGNDASHAEQLHNPRSYDSAGSPSHKNKSQGGTRTCSRGKSQPCYSWSADALRETSSSHVNGGAATTQGTLQPSLVPSTDGIISAASKSHRPLSRRPNSSQKDELRELEELRQKNMRLERDLFESLQALEEESITSGSSCSSPEPSPRRESPTLEVPRCDSSRPSRETKVHELRVPTGGSSRPSLEKEVETPPTAFCGSASPKSNGDSPDGSGIHHHHHKVVSKTCSDRIEPSGAKVHLEGDALLSQEDKIAPHASSPECAHGTALPMFERGPSEQAPHPSEEIPSHPHLVSHEVDADTS